MQAMEDLLISALKVSGELLLGYFEKPVKTAYKESQSSIVTEADIESDRLIISTIRKKFPTHNIISEESGFISNNSEYTWVIDPMDGTSNFASGVPWFGVLISVFKNNIPVMGGAYLPVQDTLFFAQTGKGAFKNGKQLPLLSNKDAKDSLIALNMDYTEEMTTLAKYMEVYENVIKSSRNLRSTNSLVDFIYVAEGKFGAVINLNTRVWDISAFYVIVQETGGKMLNINGNDLEFSLDETIIEKNFPVVAGTDQIIKALIFRNI